MSLSYVKQHLEQLPEYLRKIVPSVSPLFKSLQNITYDQADSIPLYSLINLLASYLQQSQHPLSKPYGIISHKTVTVAVFCQPSQELSQFKVSAFCSLSYCQWLQSAGAVCLPLSYDSDQTTIANILSRVNGLLVPGGAASMWLDRPKQNGFSPVVGGFRRVWRIIKSMWDKGAYLPLWGTCLGLQLVLICLCQGDLGVLNVFDSRYHSLNIYSDYNSSKLLHNTPFWMREQLETGKVMFFNHAHGISLKRYLHSQKYGIIRKHLKLISVSQDKRGEWFCCYLQGKKYPLFLSQYHPEKNQFQEMPFHPNTLNKNGEAILTVQAISAAFVNQCRKSTHSFEREVFVRQAMYNYEQQFLHEKKFRAVLIRNDMRKKGTKRALTVSKK